MNRKALIFLILICFAACGRLSTQSGIADNEQYNSYELSILLDNLAQEFIPVLFYNTYYGSIKTNDYKSSQIMDTGHKKREVHIRTRKAKDGYLLVNKCVMDYVANNEDICFEGLKVAYVYNNKAVLTDKDVLKILSLRKRCIKVSDIVPDNQSGLITVYIHSR